MARSCCSILFSSEGSTTGRRFRLSHVSTTFSKFVLEATQEKVRCHVLVRRYRRFSKFVLEVGSQLLQHSVLIRR